MNVDGATMMVEQVFPGGTWWDVPKTIPMKVGEAKRTANSLRGEVAACGVCGGGDAWDGPIRAEWVGVVDGMGWWRHDPAATWFRDLLEAEGVDWERGLWVGADDMCLDHLWDAVDLCPEPWMLTVGSRGFKRLVRANISLTSKRDVKDGGGEAIGRWMLAGRFRVMVCPHPGTILKRKAGGANVYGAIKELRGLFNGDSAMGGVGWTDRVQRFGVDEIVGTMEGLERCFQCGVRTAHGGWVDGSGVAWCSKHVGMGRQRWNEELKVKVKEAGTVGVDGTVEMFPTR